MKIQFVIHFQAYVNTFLQYEKGMTRTKTYSFCRLSQDLKFYSCHKLTLYPPSTRHRSSHPPHTFSSSKKQKKKIKRGNSSRVYFIINNLNCRVGSERFNLFDAGPHAEITLIRVLIYFILRCSLLTH